MKSDFATRRDKERELLRSIEEWVPRIGMPCNGASFGYGVIDGMEVTSGSILLIRIDVKTEDEHEPDRIYRLPSDIENAAWGLKKETTVN